MKYLNMRISREQLDRKLSPLKDLAISGMPKQGWIRTIREALGMTSGQLAKKAGLGQPRISRLENAEMAGDLKVSSLQKIAKALGMRLVYGFVSEGALEDMVRNQAKKIVLRRMERLDRTMQLEQQGLSDEEKSKAVEDMIDKLLMENAKDLWDVNDE
jgi:predicted DNA-binding mobile mystery protein A